MNRWLVGAAVLLVVGMLPAVAVAGRGRVLDVLPGLAMAGVVATLDMLLLGLLSPALAALVAAVALYADRLPQLRRGASRGPAPH
jgi:hypothetical protein